MPIEMAMPDSDMMFDGMSKCRIRMNDTSTASGSVMQITNALRKWQQDQQDRERGDDHLVRTDRRVSVWIAPSISRVRS